jgi:hypothetical protein
MNSEMHKYKNQSANFALRNYNSTMLDKFCVTCVRQMEFILLDCLLASIVCTNPNVAAAERTAECL